MDGSSRKKGRGKRMSEVKPQRKTVTLYAPTCPTCLNEIESEPHQEMHLARGLSSINLSWECKSCYSEETHEKLIERLAGHTSECDS